MVAPRTVNPPDSESPPLHQLSRIFDFGGHWEQLIHRPTFHAPVLDGVRAIAVLLVVLNHFVHMHMGILPQAVNSILSAPMTSWISRGDLGVALFFVLSGFLIASILFRERQKTATIRFSRFYARRFLRLMPVYGVAMLMGLFLLNGENARNMWANILYINNFLPMAQQYMGWCWSLAIEEQFYLVLPAVLVVFFGVGRGRLRLLVGVLAVLGLIEFAAFWMNGLVRYEPGVTDDGRWFDITYDKPWMRSGELLTGVIGSFLVCYRKAGLERFFARTWLVRAVVLGVLGIKGLMRVGLSHLPSWAVTLWTSYQRDEFAALVMFAILAATYSPDILWGWLKSVLSWKGFYPVAQISYSVYLVHEMIAIWLFPRLAPMLKGQFGPYGTIVADGIVAFLLVLVISVVLYVTIEKPCMEMRSLPMIQDLGKPKETPRVLEAIHPLQ